MRTLFLWLFLSFVPGCLNAAPLTDHDPAPLPSPSPFYGARILYQWDWRCDAANCILGGPLVGPAGAPIPEGRTVSIWLVAMPNGASSPSTAYFVFLPETSTWVMTQIAANFNFTASHLTLNFAGIPGTSPQHRK